MKKIYKLLVTGGPLAGKDSVIIRLKNDLERAGYYVIYTNELAECIMRHNIRPFGEEKVSTISFQDAVFKEQLFIEKLYIDMAEQISTDKPIVIIFNRGILDGKAFLKDEEFSWIMKNNNFTLDNIELRYDIVICLETLAKLGVYNQHDNNEVRFQNKQEALELNDKFYEDYSVYYKVDYIKAEENFEDKYQKILDILLNKLYTLIKNNSNNV